MEIILLNEEDKGSLLLLYKQVTRSLRKDGIDQWDRFYPNRFVIGKDVKRGTTFGIKKNQQVIGAVTVDYHQADGYKSIPWQGQNSGACCIHRLAVYPDYQGMGLGKRLLQFAEDKARQEGSTSIRLDVYSANPSAVALYEKACYIKKGEITFPLRKLPYICMEKDLLE